MKAIVHDVQERTDQPIIQTRPLQHVGNPVGVSRIPVGLIMRANMRGPELSRPRTSRINR